MECLKQSRGVIFGYKINLFSDHNNLVYVSTLSVSQRVFHWKLKTKEFGTNIQHIYVIGNIVADTLNIIVSVPNIQGNTITSRSKSCVNELLTTSVKKKYNPPPENS